MVTGNSIYFRFVEESDAGFILSLRLDSNLNKHLSHTGADIAAQKQWLIDYKERERLDQEYYFIICRKSDDQAIGTVRLYDFILPKKSFCWGSWILNANKTRTSAIESAILVYEFAFKIKGFENCHFDVRKENKHVNKFHQRFGAERVKEIELDYFYEYSKKKYIQFFEKNSQYIGK